MVTTQVQLCLASKALFITKVNYARAWIVGLRRYIPGNVFIESFLNLHTFQKDICILRINTSYLLNSILLKIMRFTWSIKTLGEKFLSTLNNLKGILIFYYHGKKITICSTVWTKTICYLIALRIRNAVITRLVWLYLGHRQDREMRQWQVFDSFWRPGHESAPTLLWDRSELSLLLLYDSFSILITPHGWF